MTNSSTRTPVDVLLMSMLMLLLLLLLLLLLSLFFAEAVAVAFLLMLWMLLLYVLRWMMDANVSAGFHLNPHLRALCLRPRTPALPAGAAHAGLPWPYLPPPLPLPLRLPPPPPLPPRPPPLPRPLSCEHRDGGRRQSNPHPIPPCEYAVFSMSLLLHSLTVFFRASHDVVFRGRHKSDFCFFLFG